MKAVQLDNDYSWLLTVGDLPRDRRGRRTLFITFKADNRVSLDNLDFARNLFSEDDFVAEG